MTAQCERAPTTATVPGPNPGGMVSKRRIGLTRLADLRRFGARVVNMLHTGEIDENRARAFGYLLSTMAGIIKESELETRLAELEKLVEQRGGR